MLYKLYAWLTRHFGLGASETTNTKSSKIISAQVDLWSVYTFFWVHIDQLYCFLFTIILPQKEVKVKDCKAVVLRYIFKIHFFSYPKRMKKHWGICERTVSCCNRRMLETGYDVDNLRVAK